MVETAGFGEFLQNQVRDLAQKAQAVEEKTIGYAKNGTADIDAIAPMVAELSLRFEEAVKITSQGISSLKSLLNMPM